MSILEISSVTTRFVLAEMAYVELIEKAVDFENKGLRGISAAELSAVLTAKQKRDALEEEMFAVWAAYQQHPNGGK